jgi:hypothetical protein
MPAAIEAGDVQACVDRGIDFPRRAERAADPAASTSSSTPDALFSRGARITRIAKRITCLRAPPAAVAAPPIAQARDAIDRVQPIVGSWGELSHARRVMTHGSPDAGHPVRCWSSCIATREQARPGDCGVIRVSDLCASARVGSSPGDA